MSRLRLGVALLLPPPVADEVDGLRRALGDRNLGRVPAHITLVPPVNVRPEHLGQALAVLRAAAAATPIEVTITLDGPSSFLPANPVLYLPVGGDVGAVHALRERLWAPPFIRTLAWPFVAHVTLADEASEPRIAAALVALARYTATVPFDRVHLLVERRPGPHWRPLADVVFGPPAIVARGGPLAVELARSQQLDPEGVAFLEAEGPKGADLEPAPLAQLAPRGQPADPQLAQLADPQLADPQLAQLADPQLAQLADPQLADPQLAQLAQGSRLELATAAASAAGTSAVLFVTARREGAVVGVGGAWIGRDGLHTAVLVAAEHRRQGIGRHVDAALHAAVARAGWGCRYPKRMAE